jgi:hypothetical protein
MFVRYRHEERSLEKAFVNRERRGNGAGNGPPVGGTPATGLTSPLLYKFAYLDWKTVHETNINKDSHFSALL